MLLDGKTVAVVGGSKQVDRAAFDLAWTAGILRRAAAEGAKLLVVDPDPAWIEFARAAVGEDRVEGLVLDIDDCDAMTRAAQAWGAPEGLHGLVTSYMDIAWHSVEEADPAVFDRVLLHNLGGPLRATKAFLPLLKKSPGSSIVHVSSVDGIHGAPAVPGYSAAKGGLVPLTHCMAYEFAPYDVRVNMIASCSTVEMQPVAGAGADMSKSYSGFPGAHYMAQLNAATPLKRYGPMADWAGAAVFLLSDYSRYMTGSVVTVDCGRTAITPGTHTRPLT